jgi:basic membrane protein A
MEGYRNLGFIGGAAVPAVQRFGHGFIQGAEHAVDYLGLNEGDVSIRFHYLGGFAPDPAHTAFAGGWFAAGVEVIFAAAGGAGASVIGAAEAAGTSIIGVDVDQSGASEVVITSAMKALAVSVYDLLTHYVAGTFPGGRVEMYDAAANGVALPMENSRFQEFTQAQYDAIFAQLASGAVAVNNTLDFDEIVAGVSLVTVIPT